MIWIGTSNGLYRYDGVSFEQMPPSSPRPLQADGILALLATKDGDLWVGHEWGGISLFSKGQHRPVDHLPYHTVFYMRGTGPGPGWAVTGDGRDLVIARLMAGRWESWVSLPFTSWVNDVTEGKDGSLWMLFHDRLFITSPTQRITRQASPEPLVDASLAADGDGAVWLITRTAIRRLSPASGTALAQIGPPLPRPAVKMGGRVIFDGQHAFWSVEDDNQIRRYGFAEGQGAQRLGTLWKSPYRLPILGENLHDLPALVDREGNLWLGTNRGLERFSPSAFRPMMVDDPEDGHAFSPPYAIRDGAGAVWLRHGHDLYRTRADGQLLKQPVTLPEEFVPCPGAKGSVWIPQGRDRLSLLGGDGRQWVSMAGTQNLGKLTYGGHCVEDDRGRLWVGDQHGLMLLGPSGARAIALGEDSGSGVINVLPDGRGNVLAYVGHGSLWRTDGVHTQQLWKQQDMTLGMIEVMYQAPHYLLLGGDRGLVQYDGKAFRTLHRDRFPALSITSGIVQTEQGDSWFQTDKGMVRIHTKDLERAFLDPAFRPAFDVFGLSDGLPGPPSILNMSDITADREGRVWGTTNGGIAVYDPHDARFNRAAPPVMITGLQVDRQRYGPQPGIVLPPGTTRLKVDFTALSFVDPAHMRFRYRLSGVDQGWVDGGSTRSASYTSLGPGSYQFQVTAANKDGDWNAKGATVDLVIQPYVYQTMWFRGLCLVLIGVAAWLLYRWRVGLVARHMRNRAAERAHERERIARDLHDTLLQGVQGLVLHVQSVASRMRKDDPNRALLDRTLDRADGLIAEGKSRVLGLRTADQAPDFVADLQRLLDDAAFPVGTARDFSLEGEARTMQASAALEAREIVSEALFNAARHAQASHVGLAVRFHPRWLEITITDDGIGIPCEQARPGLGLTGMHERAESIGATVTIQPGSAAGTVVSLRIPARRAYVRQPWFSGLSS